MCSQAGSPFRKARRTREERRKTIIGQNNEGYQNENSEHLAVINDENSMINISPLRKNKAAQANHSVNKERPGQSEVFELFLK
jgi:hypothetical protein